MSREKHVLSEKTEHDFRDGKLKPLLEAVCNDRDLILEFRGPSKATIYCKGHCLEIQPSGDGYKISAHEKFLENGSAELQSDAEIASFVNEKLPRIKRAIATHGSGGMEIEFEQALIRANNLEPSLNTDYFAVDRQALLGSDRDRIDVLGVYWPDHGSDKEVALALIEVKYALAGKIDKLAVQVAGYYDALKANIGDIAENAQALLRQKLRMGLITGGDRKALEKLQRLTISRDPKQVKIVLAMVDYNPRSTLLTSQLEKLREFHSTRQLVSPIEVYYLGFGLWAKKAKPVPDPGAAAA